LLRPQRVERLRPLRGLRAWLDRLAMILSVDAWSVVAASVQRAEIATKLAQANGLATQGKLQSHIARTLGVSVMTLHRWRKAPPGAQPAHETGEPGQTRGGGDRIAELQLENSRLRRLVTDLLLEKIKSEETAQRQPFFGVTGRNGIPIND